MNTDKAQLKALAEAAQAWSGEIGEQRWYEAECFKQPYFGLPDAEFLTAISPVTVLALIAEIDGLHAQHGRDSGELRKLCASRDSARRERDQLSSGPRTRRYARTAIACWKLEGTFYDPPRPAFHGLERLQGAESMNRPVTERDFRRPEFMNEKPEDYEFRADGAIVRKDRWEQGIHHIHSIIGPRGDFEIQDVVDAVSKLKGNWFEADPEEDPVYDHIDIRLSCGSILAGCERIGTFAYRWPFGDKRFGSMDFGADVIEWQMSAMA